MLTLVRLAVLSFLLAFTAANSIAAPYEHSFAYNPATGMIASVNYDRDGFTGKVWPITDVQGKREDVDYVAGEWILDEELPKEDYRKPVVTKDFEKAHIIGLFPGGKYLLRMESGGYRLSAPEGFLFLRDRKRINNHFGKLESGETVLVKSLLKDGRLWVVPMGESHGYFREREGVVVIPSAGEIEEDGLDLIREAVALDFNGFSVRDLDLTDETQFQLFRLYILTRFMTSEEGFRRLNRRSEDLLRFLAENPDIPPKLELQTIDLKMRSRTLRLRLMQPLEAVFRGCLGDDCSTDTRFFRALEPAHLNFAIEEVPYRGLGQIEVVLGKSADTAENLAFLERVQSPKALREPELRELIMAVYAQMRKAGYKLVMPESLSTYTEVAHPIANNRGIVERLETVFASSFTEGKEHFRLMRNPDVLPNQDPNKVNLVANSLREKMKPVFEIEPAPETMMDHLDHASIAEGYNQPKDLKAFLAKLRAKISGLAGTQKSHDLMLTDKSWKELEAKIFTSPCEYRVLNPAKASGE